MPSSLISEKFSHAVLKKILTDQLKILTFAELNVAINLTKKFYSCQNSIVSQEEDNPSFENVLDSLSQPIIAHFYHFASEQLRLWQAYYFFSNFNLQPHVDGTVVLLEILKTTPTLTAEIDKEHYSIQFLLLLYLLSPKLKLNTDPLPPVHDPDIIIVKNAIEAETVVKIAIEHLTAIQNKIAANATLLKQLAKQSYLHFSLPNTQSGTPENRTDENIMKM